MTRSSLIALAALAAGLSLKACAMAPLAPPQASIENIQTLRTAQVQPMAVGAFVPGPGGPTEMDNQIAVRGGIQAAPGGSFARYLGDTVSAELAGAGKLDPAAKLIVSGVLTDTHVDSSMDTPRAWLQARITLVRDGRTVFDKVERVDSSWDGNFIGAVAIPDAINHCQGLFAQLAGKLFADPEFVAAAKAP